MKKIAILCCAVALLLQSCSTGSMFNHKRYGHLNWIDHDTKVETNGKESTPLTEQKQLKSSQQTAAKNEVTSTNTLTEELVVNNTNPITVQESEVNIIQSSTRSQDVALEETSIIEPEHNTKMESNQVFNKPTSAIKEVKEGSTGELLLMAVLIALALILFFVLDSALGGILSLILIIFLILVLLRYFGVF